MGWKDKRNRKEYFNKRRERYRKLIQEYKERIGKCEYCNWDEHVEILQFHHRNKEKKKMKISVGSIGNYKWETILRELEKCDLICPNCHLWLHYKETAK